ncbi:MAG: hypothetical protein M3P30_15680 [Chloroflexota bacterium]|nr:hypothetical protein [Chloroflexota bacterium]
MERDPIREWRRALHRRQGKQRLALTALTVPREPGPFVMPAEAKGQDPLDLRRTRRLTAVADWQLDLGVAIRLLQRHNKLLRTRFGIGWAEVAGVLLGEARRRGVSTENLARVLTAGLRHDAQGHSA